MAYTASVRGLAASGESGKEVPVVLLEARGEVLPIFISADQAQSIKHALDGSRFERPLTHDLLVEMTAEFGAAIDRVRIDGLADGTFLAKVDAEQYRDGDRREIVFDARPSDGIALGLRVDCDIEISDDVLDSAGRSPEEFDFLE